jgi:hypothetical protein
MSRLCCVRTGASESSLFPSHAPRDILLNGEYTIPFQKMIRVLLDDTDVTGTRGGQIYERYGISRSKGALVVVRPDGYVGAIAPLDDLAALDVYFAGFMQSR